MAGLTEPSSRAQGAQQPSRQHASHSVLDEDAPDKLAPTHLRA
jgi:hypothetical protein